MTDLGPDLPRRIIDIGPYSARNTSKGALLSETAQVISALATGLSLEETRQKAVDGSLLRQPMRTTRMRIWHALHYRLFSPRMSWITAALSKALAAGGRSREFTSMVYLHYALSDHLTYDVITDLAWKRWTEDRPSISRVDVLSFLDRAVPAQPQIERWSESSRLKLAGGVLTALRDFGILEGTQKKRMTRPVLPLQTAEHLLRILTQQEVMGNDAVEHPAWRLFLCAPHDVADTLGRLAMARRIGFERSGGTVVLHTPEEWRA